MPKSANQFLKISLASAWTTRERLAFLFEANSVSFAQTAAALIAQSLRRKLKEKEFAVFVPSAGKTPTEIYKLLAQNHKNDLDWRKVIVVQMDEYLNISCAHPRSMAFYLECNLTGPLGIKNFVHFFDANGAYTQPLNKYEAEIYRLGGIDIVSHGLGRNGHIGFNEPDSSWDSLTRIVTLETSTLEANFGSDAYMKKTYSRGVTLGLQCLTQAEHAFLLMAGDGKEKAARSFFEDEPSVGVPASSIFLNHTATAICDVQSIFPTLSYKKPKMSRPKLALQKKEL